MANPGVVQPGHSIVIDQAALVAWKSRREHLLELVAEDPHGPWAWLWRTRAKILDYMLERYSAGADAEDLSLQRTQDAVPGTPVSDAPEESPSPYDHSPPLDVGVIQHELTADRGAGTRLASLQRVNERRRAVMPPIPPAPPPMFGHRFVNKLGQTMVWLLAPVAKTFAPSRMRERLPPWLDDILFMEIHPARSGVELHRAGTEGIDAPALPGLRVLRQTFPDDLLPRASAEESQQLAELIGALDDAGIELLHHIVSMDLGLRGIDEDLLHPEVVRAVLDEHGIGRDDRA